MQTIALDVGKHAVDWCEVKEGKVVRRGRAVGAEGLKGILGEGTDKAHVGFEACRQARHLHDTLVAWGHEVTIFDTTRVRAMGVGAHGRKNDRIDAETLALALERGYFAKAHVLGDVARELRELQEVHRELTQTRARLSTHIRGLAQGRGVILPSCAVEDLARRLRESSLPEPLRTVVEPLICTLEIVTPQLARVDLRIQELCEGQADPVVQRLASVPGVGVLVAAAFVSVVDDAGRFQSAPQVASYLGLCPSENTTGGNRRLGSITKQGNAYLRLMLVQAAWCILRSRNLSDVLVRAAHRISARRGRMRAAVAIARRLSRILWRMWKDGTFYDPKGLPNPAHARPAPGIEPNPQDTPVARAQRSHTMGVQKLARQKRANERCLHRASNKPSAEVSTVLN